MIPLRQDIYTILNEVLNYNTQWQSRMLIWIMKENMMMKLIYFINKKIPDFWISWNSKFKKKVDTNVQINCLTDNKSIANCFGNHLHPCMLTPRII